MLELVLDQLPHHQKTKHYIFVDEVGRGCLAGPVVVGGCLWINNHRINNQSKTPASSWLKLRDLGIQDSKKVPEKKRLSILESLSLNPFKQNVTNLDLEGDRFYLTLDQMDVGVIEKINILAATIDLMRKVAVKLCTQAMVNGDLTEGESVTVIIDGKEKISQLQMHSINFLQLAVPKSDYLFAPTGLASIYAKVYRDHQMQVWDQIYPNYDLGKHKGYGTAKHLASIKSHGPSPIHRKTFAGVKEHFTSI